MINVIKEILRKLFLIICLPVVWFLEFSQWIKSKFYQD